MRRFVSSRDSNSGYPAFPAPGIVAIDRLFVQPYISDSRTGDFMGAQKTIADHTIVVSALHARASFGRLLRRVEDERRSLVIEKRGTPRAILISIRDYVRLAAPEPEVLEIVGRESKRKRTDSLTSRQIDRIIKA